MRSDAGDEHAEQSAHAVEVTILESRAVDELVGKIQMASAAPDAAARVEGWLGDHADAAWSAPGHDHVVVGDDLMYLHDAPDGTAIPHERHTDGREQVYTDLAHAEAAYRR